MVDRIGDPALLGGGDLDVEEAAGDVEGADPLDELGDATVGRLLQAERDGELIGVEGAVTVEGGHELRPGIDVDVEVRRRAYGAQRVADLGARKPLLPEQVGELAVSVAEGLLVDARALPYAVLRLEVAHLSIGAGIDHEDALDDGARRPRLDLDRDHDLGRVVGVRGVDLDLGRRKAMVGVVAPYARAHLIEQGRCDLALLRDLGRVQRVGRLERPAADLDRRDDAPREQVDPEDGAVALGQRLDRGSRELPGVERLSHRSAPRLEAQRLTGPDARERRRGGPPAPADLDLDPADRLAGERKGRPVLELGHRRALRLIFPGVDRLLAGRGGRGRLRVRAGPEHRDDEDQKGEQRAEGSHQGARGGG